MRLELRSSGGEPCEVCGSLELLHVDEKPLATDLSHALEVEMLRREIRLAQVFRDHLAETERGYADSLVNQQQKALLEHGVLLSEMTALLEGMKLDVTAWRVFKHHREKRFKQRVDAAIAELREQTRFPFTEPPKVLNA